MSFFQSGSDSRAALFENFNWFVFIIVAGLMLVGIAQMYTVAQGDVSPWAWRQAIRVGLGVSLLVSIALVHIRFWYDIAYFIYGGALCLLILVSFIGESHMGAARWLDLGIIQLQPSELMRIGVVLALARYYQSIQQEEVSFMSRLIIPILMIAIPVFLIIRQPDLGTGILLGIIGIFVLFMAGVNWRFFAAGFIVILSLIPLVWPQLHEYQQKRILTLLNPEGDPLGSGYHIIQSKIGIGSGGLSGKGFLQSTQSRLNFLPEKHTDFIFTLWAEEMGFVGSVTLISLYCMLFGLIIYIMMSVRTCFARLMVAGFLYSLFFYVFVNLSMVMGMAPIVGIPLPFISYGGTSLLTFAISIGLILSADANSQFEMSRG